MLYSPLGRCFGIGVLLVSLIGLFVLGGASWSLDGAVAADSNGIDEIGMFSGANLDIGAEYRTMDSASPDEFSGTDSTVTAGVNGEFPHAEVLFAPTDQSEAIHFGGVRFLYLISLLGAALVSVRALVGWRLDIWQLAFEPREQSLFGQVAQTDQQPTPVRDQQSHPPE